MNNTIQTITPQQLHEKLSRNEQIELIDVRAPAEYGQVHATPARSVPLHELNVDDLARQHSDCQSWYVICKSGARARQACQKFMEAGYNRVICVEGGTDAWVEAGLPVVRGRKAVSLERQVRIAAGILVVIGVLLGLFIHPGWLGLAGFVGAGLVFAGITDTCGMALLLARMPWNQTCCKTACKTT